MDDRTFDETTAREWIETIEGAQSSPRDHDIYPRLNVWLRDTQPAALLEVGSGQGVCSDKIDLERCLYTGVEPSPYLLQRANELYAGGHRRFVQGSAYSMPCDADSFDAAFSVAVWHLLNDLSTAARELGRVLRTCGSFLIITANPAAYALWTERYAAVHLDGRRVEGQTRNGDGSVSTDVLYLHTLEEITGSLDSAGLAPRTIETFRTTRSGDSFLAIEGEKKARTG